MKWAKSVLLLVILFGAAASDTVWADHGGHAGGRGRADFGVYIGPSMFWPYYPGPYYYPPVIVVPSSPPVYMEQESSSPQQYWYFCDDPQGYYPYVKQCPSGWQQVTPQPPGN